MSVIDAAPERGRDAADVGETPRPADRRNEAEDAPRMRQIAVVAALSTIASLIIGATMASLAVYLHDFQVFASHAADLATGGFLLGMAVSNLVAGISVSRFGVRATVLAGVACVAAGWWGAGNARTGGELVAALLLTGAGVGLATIVPGIAFISATFGRRAGLVLAGFIGACALSSAVAPVVVAEHLQAYGWRATCSASAVLFAIVCLPLALLAPGATSRNRLGREGGRAETLRRLFNLRYGLVVLACLLAQLSLNGILISGVDILRASGLHGEHAVHVYSLANLVGVPVLFASGYALSRGRPTTVFCVGVLAQALGTLALLGIGKGGAAGASELAFVLLWGGASTIPAQASPLILAELFEERLLPVALGVSAAISSITGAAAPVIAAALGSADGGFRPSILLFTAAAGGAAAPMIAVALRRARSAPALGR